VFTTDALATALADRYTIERLIGEGGMARVFLARDLRHNRRVALKVLRPNLWAVVGVDRFQAEIEVTANLQHPNLLPLFDSGVAGDLLFYVMPYVEGESLRARIDREKQLPVDEAVRLASAVAAALDYAHRHGVIHRDLKPENILLHDGQPLVADFGIALAISNASGARITQTGISLGTPQYMSPEQATGDRAIDARSDVYSLSAVVYEMLVGNPPHVASTAQAVISKVLTERAADVRASRPSVSEPVALAISRGLEKLPADRWATAAEFADAVTGKIVQPVARASAERPVGHQLKWIIAATLLGAAFGGGVAWRVATKSSTPPIATEFELNLPSGVEMGSGIGTPFVLTPDGRTLIYKEINADSARLYKRMMDSVAPAAIAGSAGAQMLFGSPDGKWVGFVSANNLKKIPIDGGAAVTIVAGVISAGATWTADNTIIFSRGAALWAVSAAGGRPSLVARSDTVHGETDMRLPFALGDGQTILYASWQSRDPAATRLAVIKRDGRRKISSVHGTHVLGAIDDVILYAQYDPPAIMAVHFDAARDSIVGEPVQLVTNVAVGAHGPAKAAFSAAGTLVYKTGAADRHLVLFDSTLKVQRPIFSNVRAGVNPRFSPNGNRIAVSTGEAMGQVDLWVLDLTQQSALKLVSGGDNSAEAQPAWTLDGKRIAYTLVRNVSTGSTDVSIFWQSSDGSDKSEALQPSAGGHGVEQAAFAPDGAYLLYSQHDSGGSHLRYRPLGIPSPAKSLNAALTNERGSVFSPDGHWIAYASSVSGTAEVYVQAFPGGGAKYPISTGGGTEPVWSVRDGRIYYRRGRQLVATTIATSPTFHVVSRDTVFSFPPTFVAFPGMSASSPGRDWDIGRDGRLVMVAVGDTSSALRVKANWLPALRSKLKKR
jgi:serine/threonine-protein kinase